MIDLGDAKKVEKKKSLFDEYDAENGYTEENDINIEKSYKDCIDFIVKYAIEGLKNSYLDTLNTPMDYLLDFIKYDIKYNEEHKEDY